MQQIFLVFVTNLTLGKNYDYNFILMHASFISWSMLTLVRSIFRSNCKRGATLLYYI